MEQFEFLLYKAAEEDVTVNAVIKDESIWLTQKSMAELFGCGIDNISIHLRNVYNDGELAKEGTIEKISIVQNEGGRRTRKPRRSGARKVRFRW